MDREEIIIKKALTDFTMWKEESKKSLDILRQENWPRWFRGYHAGRIRAYKSCIAYLRTKINQKET